MKLVIEDNFFDNPDELREIALNLEQYRLNESVESRIGWKGQRSDPFRMLNLKVLDESCKKVYDFIYDALNLSEYRYPDLNGFNGYADGKEISGKKPEELTITGYFHVTTESTKNGFPDFWTDRFHKDYLPCAGIVYLTPNAPLEAGTSVLDGPNNQFVNVQNKYNRLVAYDGYYIHGLSNVFGESRETGRLTFTFFVHEEKYTGQFE
jgi:hypothetical protein